MKHNYKRMKQVYDLISSKDRTIAEICLKLKLPYTKYRDAILRDVDCLCYWGFLIRENDTDNNIWLGVMSSKINSELYNQYLINA